MNLYTNLFFKLFWCIVFQGFISIHFTFAQEKKVVSIQAQFQSLKEQGVKESDTAWISLLNAYASAQANVNPDSSLKIALNALGLAQNLISLKASSKLTAMLVMPMPFLEMKLERYNQ